MLLPFRFSKWKSLTKECCKAQNSRSSLTNSIHISNTKEDAMRPPEWCVETPPKNLVCSECGQGWNILGSRPDLDHVMSYETTQEIGLDRFVGKSIRTVLAGIFSCRIDGLYEMDPFWHITNELLIPEGKYSRRGKEDGICLDYLVQKGDVGVFKIVRFAHFACNRARLTTEGRNSFDAMFHKAGFSQKWFQAIPHGHFPAVTAMKCEPWYIAHTEVGPIRVGWQTRVLNINWDQITPKRDLEHLFTESVTKMPCEVHANDTAQGIQFLQRIREALV